VPNFKTMGIYLGVDINKKTNSYEEVKSANWNKQVLFCIDATIQIKITIKKDKNNFIYNFS